MPCSARYTADELHKKVTRAGFEIVRSVFRLAPAARHAGGATQGTWPGRIRSSEKAAAPPNG